MEPFHSLLLSLSLSHTQGLWETYLQQDKSKYFSLAGLRNCEGTEDLHGKSHKSLLHHWTCKRGVDSGVPVSIVVRLLSVWGWGLHWPGPRPSLSMSSKVTRKAITHYFSNGSESKQNTSHLVNPLLSSLSPDMFGGKTMHLFFYRHQFHALKGQCIISKMDNYTALFSKRL